MRKIVLTIASFLLFHAVIWAQNKTINGKVTDSKTGGPLGGATVQVPGDKNAAKTSTDGTFTVTVPQNSKTLLISFVGYEPQRVDITTARNVGVQLTEVIQKEEEVILVGYVKRKKKDEAGAITVVKGSDIADQPNASLDKALQGAAAGVTVQANNGIPGGNIRMNIRGISSFGTTTTPLFVIDGIPFSTGSLSSFTQTNPLAFLNQSDIETIEILKDAASTAIYGASGANGVVLVTTKKGKNQKTKLGINFYTGFNKPLKKMDVLSTQEYFAYRMEGLNNQQKLSGNNLSNQALKSAVLQGMEVPLLYAGLTNAQIAAMSEAQLDALIARLPNTDWQNEVFRTGIIRDVELTLNGGNEKTQFYTSASYQKNNSIINKTDFQRGGIKVDVTNKMSDKVKVNFNLNASSVYQNAPFATDGSFLGSPAFSASGILPHNPVLDSTGNYFGLTPGKLAGLLSHNIIAVNDYNKGYEKTNQVVGVLNIDYSILKWLNYRASASIDYRYNNGRLLRDMRTPDGAGTIKGRATTHGDWITNRLTTHTLSFNKAFGQKHNFDGFAGYEYRHQQQEGVSSQKTGFPIANLTLLSAAGQIVSADEYYTEFKKNSVFGQLYYNYDRRYSIGLSIRRDGSSRFGADTRFGTFKSIKAVWNADREKFLSNVKAISNLRFRISYGQTGSDNIGNFDALGLYGSGTLYNGQSGIFPSQLASPNLSWENVSEKNFGFDLGLFRSRINLNIDVYDKRTNDILQNVTLPTYTGWTSLRQNSGKVSNKGIEITLGGDIIRPKTMGGLSWTASVNFAYNDNRILDIINGSPVLNGSTINLLNKPIGQILTTNYAGVNPATGRPMWYDSTGAITYAPLPKDRYYAGIGAGGLPPYTGGLTTTLSYHGVSMEVNLSYQYGQVIADGQYNFLMENIARLNTLRENYDNRWKNPGQLTAVPRANANGAEPNGVGAQTGDRLLMKTDFIRVRSISLNYDLPSSVLGKLKMSNARFYVQGGNLFTYAPAFKGYDPEFVTTATGIVPQSKNVTVGLQMTF
jgi:TonB-dependent starch-binding outer membrane protein SusC